MNEPDHSDRATVSGLLLHRHTHTHTHTHTQGHQDHVLATAIEITQPVRCTERISLSTYLKAAYANSSIIHHLIGLITTLHEPDW